MAYPVTYYCPRCETVAELRREGYLADKSVTPYPFEGWEYAPPEGEFEEADGVRIVCGESEAPGLTFHPRPVEGDGEATFEDPVSGTDTAARAPEDGDPGCGEPYYLSFVRFEDGREVDPQGTGERVRLAESRTPDGPRGPPEPGC